MLRPTSHQCHGGPLNRSAPPPMPSEQYLRESMSHQHSEHPVFRRIALSIRDGIQAGRLRPGDRLPPQRALAAALEVAVPTVSRGYREAESQGLIDSTVGRGTFIAGLPTLRQRPDVTDNSAGSALDLSVNGPAYGPHEKLLRHATQQLAKHPQLAEMLNYASDIGARRARQAAATWLEQQSVHVAPERIVMCQGGQHAILVALAAVLRPGDVLLTEALTYPGVKSAAEVLGLSLHGVQMDGSGLIPESLAEACATITPRPRALYLMPTAHNPTTATLPDHRRDQIVEIARQHALSIIEDDVFGLLPPPGTTPLPLVRRAPERTFYLSSLSKTLSPGLRWGLVIAPPPLIDRLGSIVRATIFNPAPIALDLATTWINDGTAITLVQWQRTEIAARFDLAHELLDPVDGVRRVHTAGLHAWLELGNGWTSTEVIERAHRTGVRLSPTEHFTALPTTSPPALPGVRICLGNAPDRVALTSGLARLRGLLEQGPGRSTDVRI